MKLKRAANAELAIYGCIAIAFAAGFAANMERRAHVTTHTRVVKVERSWGKPDQTVDGAQVNANFAGLTCKVYQARKTVVCEP